MNQYSCAVSLLLFDLTNVWYTEIWYPKNISSFAFNVICCIFVQIMLKNGLQLAMFPSKNAQNWIIAEKTCE